jgi:hypothetical protein
MRRLLALLVCCCALVVLGGCGDDSDDGNGGGNATTAVGGDNQGSLGPPTVLTFTYKESKGATAMTARLTCIPGEGAEATGYLEDNAEQACKDVDARAGLLREGPDLTKACTAIYGGPETLKASGRIDFKTVDQTFKRTNGCQIDAWNRMVPLMPPGAPS